MRFRSRKGIVGMVYFKYDASEYDRGRRTENIQFWAKEAVRIASLDSDSLILDLGCGTGNYALRLEEETFGGVYGLDPSIEMLKVGRLKSRNGQIGWMCGVAEFIPSRDGTFDCVFSSQVWHHIQSKLKAAEECYRVLKCDSPLIIRTVSHDQWREATICDFFPEILPNEIEVYPSMMEFEEYLGKAGFSNIDIIPYRLEMDACREELIEAAEKKLWSMFKYVSEENLKKGIEKLKDLVGQSVRNDELITLVIGWKF